MIFTFYSFKGGVGRSMALANVSEVFYARGLKVLMIDFDLEAPGLERYFDVRNSVTPSAEIPGRRGVIDMILSFLELQSLAPKLPPTAAPDADGQPSFSFSVEPLWNFILPIYDDPSRPGKLSLMPSGNRRKPDFAAYAKRVLDFDWASFYTEQDGERFFEWFRLELEREWDVVLIDSRTGVTELGGVSTHQLADAVISFVATNLQNLDGSAMMARSLANPKLVSEGRKGRGLQQLFVPSRVELSEEDKHDEFAARFNSQFGPYFPAGQIPEQSWFLDLRLFYVPAYSYMERVAVREPERASKADLISAFGRLAARMANIAGSGALFDAWAPSSGILSNLPPRNRYFAGREDDLKRIRALLPTGTPVAICGLGGMGKTALAVEYAYRYRTEYAATLFCPAGSSDQMWRGCQELTRMLSITTAEIRPPEALRAWLESNERWLLILDDAHDPVLVRSVLPQSLRGQVLLTTRTQQVTVLGAQPVAIESISRESSTNFFEKRLGKHEWNDTERSAAAELADEVGALPLALEQAAAYIVNRGARIQDYLASFRKRGLGLLDQQAALSAGRELSVSAALAPTLQEIEKIPASADVLRAASFLAPDPIPTFLLVDGAKELGDAILAVLSSAAGDPLAIDELLDPLTRFSLIERNRESQAFSVHRLVADLVRASVEDVPAWQQRMVAVLEAVFPDPTWENSAICAPLVPHVLAVLPWSKLPILRFRAAQYMVLRGEYTRAEECLRAADTSGEDPDTLISNQLLARVYFGQGRFKDAIPLLERSIVLAEKLGLNEGFHTSLLLNLAGNCASVGDLTRAEKLYAAALQEARKRSDMLSVILALCGRAETLVVSRPDEAIQMATEAVRYAEKESMELQAMAYQSLVGALINGGRAMEPQTIEVLQTALTVGERVYGPQHPALAGMLRAYAVLFHAHGREAEGRAVYSRAQEIIDRALGPQSLAAENFRSEYDRMRTTVTSRLKGADKSATGVRLPTEAAPVPESATPPSMTKQEEPGHTAKMPTSSGALPAGQRGREKQSSWIVYLGGALVVIALAIFLYVKFRAPQPDIVPPSGPRNSDQNTPPPPQWGVIVSEDKTLAPAYNGGPSAEWEPVRAWRAGFKDVVVFHRGTYFTVIAEPDRQSAEATINQIRKNPPYRYWAGAEVFRLSDLCPSARFDRSLQVAEASTRLYSCETSD